MNFSVYVKKTKTKKKKTKKKKKNNFDIINIPGYEFISQVCKQNYVRKSGGIGVFIKKAFSEKVTLISSDSDFQILLCGLRFTN